MILTDPGFMVMEETHDRFLRRFANRFRLRRHSTVQSRVVPQATLSLVADLPIVALAPLDNPKPVLLSDSLMVAVTAPKETLQTSRVIVLSPEERRARAIALRGLSQSRGGRFDAATASFQEAVLMDPALDLAKLPDFWRLPQEAHQAAIDAYERVGRTRDAAELTAEVRSMFQPKLFRPRHVA